MIREIRENELNDLLKLYLHLHETKIPEDSENLRNTWEEILNNPRYHIIVKEADGKIVSSCVCIIIPNLTRGVRPYAVVENVVTDSDYRGRGFGTQCLDFAKEIAVKNNCYKLILQTGSKLESTLRFYENVGYDGNYNTGFVQWLDKELIKEKTINDSKNI